MGRILCGACRCSLFPASLPIIPSCVAVHIYSQGRARVLRGQSLGWECLLCVALPSLLWTKGEETGKECLAPQQWWLMEVSSFCCLVLLSLGKGVEVLQRRWWGSAEVWPLRLLCC